MQGVALTGRYMERRVLDQLVEALPRGESRALVLHGDAGVGKSALLEYVAGRAGRCRVEWASGIQSEMELPFAGLHQLCGPMLDHLPTLPSPQRAALESVFGLRTGPAPDRFLVGLAVLGLLARVAEERCLICLVDDEQWLDDPSAQALGFVARRLGAESVGMVLAARTVSGALAGLPALAVTGLPEADARTLLESALPGPIDGRIRDQIVAETGGNPLALLELPRGLTVQELAGGFGLPGAVPLAGALEQDFRRRIEALPRPTRRFLTVAAADPSGDASLVWRASTRLGLAVDAGGPAADAGLMELGTRLRFRHPLARSAAYRAASPGERQDAHRALAESTDAALEPDRRAWHRARAASGPDEAVAADLERSARRAQARGGLSAASAFLGQAVRLTVDPQRRARRAVIAAQAAIQAGGLDAARDLVAVADGGSLDAVERANVDLLRAQLAFVTSHGAEAPSLLLAAAKRLDPIDAELSRATYLDALSAAIFNGRLAPGESGVRAVAAAALAAPPASAPRAPDFLLDGLVAQYTDEYPTGAPMLRSALSTFGEGMSAQEELHWLWLVCVAGAIRVWDHDRWDALSGRHVHLAREKGSLSELPLALTSRTYALLFAGRLDEAAVLTAEIHAANEATGSGLAPYGVLGLAALRGAEAEGLALVDATVDDATRRGEGVGITFAYWAAAALHNGLGRYTEARAAAEQACEFTDDRGALLWPTAELIEAAARTGAVDTAAAAVDQLAELTRDCETGWAQGILARSQALLQQGERAESLYRRAIARLEETRVRVDLARTHLLYGEWLRRGKRRTEAREQLVRAYEMFEAMGAAGFAERARRELQAAGARTKRRETPSRHEDLTTQEAQIAELAREGLSNPEIGIRLFISAHTVQYHLRKVFAKLGITSRSQLDGVLPPPSR
ncbi:MAG TPA: AAA family ATPase [Acidimicrobiales bacterium]|nr:AAA family ATPase [Acidimicrobiales bacterium]